MRSVAAGLVAGLIVLSGTAQARTTPFNPDPVFPIGPISDTTNHQIARLDHVASALAHHTVTVNCWSPKAWTEFQAWQLAHRNYRAAEAYGVTYFRPGRIQLSPFICQVLAQAIAKSANQPLFTAEAVTILAHESAHASGISDESQAECRAIRTDARTARLLRLSDAFAARLPHIYRGTIYPHDEPRYRTPVCPFGLPGAVVPDTLGSAAELRPVERTAAAVARSLRGWKNIGGVSAVSPLSPCGLVLSRTVERMRFGESFTGPQRGWLAEFGSARVDTRQEFATALRRERTSAHCDIALHNRLDREFHSPWRFSRGRIPSALLRLSREVHAYRMVSTDGRHTWNHDRIAAFDSADLSFKVLAFDVPVGTPIATELRAVKAALRATHELAIRPADPISGSAPRRS